MKQKAKSLLALVLALSLCLSMVCVPASASDTDNIAVADGATVTIAEEAEDGADDDEPAEADTSADEAEPEADASADEPAEEEAEADAPADEPAEESAADEPVDEPQTNEPADEADVPVVAAEDEDEEAADDTIVLTSEGGTLSSGDYILEADVVLETKLTITEGATVTLDLNGYTLTGADSKSVITVEGTFTLTDTSTAGTGVVTGGSYTNGGGVYVVSGASFTMDGGAISGNAAKGRGGGVYLEDSASFTMNGGTISNNSTVNGDGGGGVCLYTNATFVMNGGKITGNTCTYTSVQSYGGGGGVYLYTGATFTMNDGEISNNTCDGPASGGNYNDGGGIHLGAGTTFTMNGGKITGNSTDGAYGGGIAVCFGSTSTAATINITGGTISNNSATKYGGGIGVKTGKVTLNIAGGTISGNSAGTSGGGIYLYSNVNNVLNLTGGSIIGNTAVTSGGGIFVNSTSSTHPTVNLSGNPVVIGNTVDSAESNIYLKTANQYITLGELTEGASIGVTTASAPTEGSMVQFTTVETETSYYASSAGYFSSDAGYYVATDAENGYLVLTTEAPEPDVDYVAQNVTTSASYETLQAAIDAASEGDEVALLMDVAEEVTVDSNDVITLDLAGYTLTGTGDASVITVKGNLTLEDSSEAGTGMLLSSSRGTKYAAGQYFGAGIYVYSGTFTLESGTISGLTNTASAGNGAGVYVGNTSGISTTFIMNGGTISDNHAQYSTGSGGGGVYVRGSETTFYMNGGTICNNSATGVGGGVYISSATFIMTGGTITGNAATGTSNASGDGGGIATAISDTTKIELSGGTITGNTAVNNGGGIFANSSSSKASTVSVSGDIVITGNTAGDVENNVYLKTANQCLTLGELTEGASIGVTTASAPTEDTTVQFTTTETETSYYASSAVYFTSDAGYVVQANEAGYLELAPVTYVAENVTTTTYYTTLQDAIDAASEGDEVALLMDLTEDVTVASDDVITLDLAGYTLTGSGTTSVVTVNGDLTLEDSSEDGTGTVTGGSATSGGGVYVRNGAKFTMNGGTITGNTATGTYGGGGVCVSASTTSGSATFIMNGGTITGNTSSNYGGGVSSNVGTNTIAINGGEISNNTAKYGGGLYVTGSGSSLTITGGKISDNTASTNGGGIHSASGDIEISISGGSVVNNVSGGYAGGVYLYSGSSLTMTGGEISGNTAATSGGGLYLGNGSTTTVSGGAIANNAATTAGDDIYAGRSVSNPASLMLSSVPSGTLTACGHDIDGWYVDSSSSRWAEDNATAVDTSETLSATSIIALKAAHAAIVYVAENVTTSTSYTTLQDAIDAASEGDEVTLLMDVTEDVTIASDDMITLDLAGYPLIGTGAASVITVKGNLTLEDSSEDGTGTVTGGSAKYGGGVYVGEGASFTLASGTITGNTATNSGGGVYLTDATFTMTGGTISGNTGTSYGGGVCASGGTIEITGGKVSDNTAKYGGGVRGNLNTTMTISDCEISGNTGGGVFTVGSLTMIGCTVSNNTASGMGGGVRSGAALTLTNCIITGNSASNYSGGGVYAGASLTMTGCTVSGNTGTNGGGVYASADLTMTGSTVSGNTGTNGGGLYLNSGSTATVSDSSIDNNTASTAGDDIYAKASSAKPVSLTLSTPSGTLTACGHDIDGWYDDSEGARWSETNSTTVDTSETLTATSAVALKAAHSAEFAIITDPADVTAEKGTSATFTVVATGTDLTYQWQYQTATGSKWYNCTSATGEGYASDSVTLTANAGRNGYKYRCVVTNGDGETLTSEQAVLTITTPVAVDAITITAQPESVTAAKGDSVTLTVEATSNLGETLTYQWQYQTATGSKWYNCTSTTGEGYASDSITLTVNSGRNGYKYRCKITDESGNVVYTDVITLTVTTE